VVTALHLVMEKATFCWTEILPETWKKTALFSQNKPTPYLKCASFYLLVKGFLVEVASSQVVP